MPAAGYTRMFERMLDHPLITVRTGLDYAELPRLRRRLLVWTGPIDAYFDCRLGSLPYRSLTFEFETLAAADGGLLQPVAQVNYPDETVQYTRVTEFRHLTGQRATHSTLAFE